MISGNALDNDTDRNPIDFLTVTSVDGITFIGNFTVTTDSGGSLQIFSDGSYVYTPATDFIGTESVEYSINDGNGGIDVAAIHLSVFDAPPVVEHDINITTINVPVNGNVLVNDITDTGDVLIIGDGSGNPIAAATTMTTDQGGTIVINPDGTYIYTPGTDFTGEDTITLEVCDGQGNCVASELVIDVVDPIAQTENTPPVCLLYTSPSPRDLSTSRMPSSA